MVPAREGEKMHERMAECGTYCSTAETGRINEFRGLMSQKEGR